MSTKTAAQCWIYHFVNTATIVRGSMCAHVRMCVRARGKNVIKSVYGVPSLTHESRTTCSLEVITAGVTGYPTCKL